MTAKREAELETENRMLREQVADLKAVIEQVTRPPAVPWHWWVPATWNSTGVTTSGCAPGPPPWPSEAWSGPLP